MAKIDFLQSNTNEYIYPITVMEAIFSLSGVPLIQTLNEHVDAITLNYNSLLYFNDEPVSGDIGGITKGSVLKGKPLGVILDDLLHPPISPNITIETDIAQGTYPITDPDNSEGGYGHEVDLIVTECGGTTFNLDTFTVKVEPTMYPIYGIDVYISNNLGNTVKFNVLDIIDWADISEGATVPITLLDNTKSNIIYNANKVSIDVSVTDSKDNVYTANKTFYLTMPIVLARNNLNKNNDKSNNMLPNGDFSNDKNDWTDLESDVEVQIITEDDGNKYCRVENSTALHTQHILDRTKFNIDNNNKIKYRIRSNDTVTSITEIEIYYSQNMVSECTPWLIISLFQYIGNDNYVEIIRNFFTSSGSGDWEWFEFSFKNCSFYDNYKYEYVDLTKAQEMLEECRDTAVVYFRIMHIKPDFESEDAGAVLPFTADLDDISFTLGTDMYSNTYEQYYCIPNGDNKVHIDLPVLENEPIVLNVPTTLPKISKIIDKSGFNIFSMFKEVNRTTSYITYSTAPVNDRSDNNNYLTLSGYSFDIYFE